MKRNALLFCLFFAALVTRGASQTYPLQCTIPSVITPSHEIGVQCWSIGSGSARITADLVPLSESEALELYQSRSDWRIQNARRDDEHELQMGQNTPFETTLDPRRPGAYAVRVFRDEQLVLTRLSTVSRFGLVTITADTRHLVAPVDLSTYRVYRAPVDIQRLGSAGAAGALERSSDNVSSDAAAYGTSTLYYAMGDDGSFAVTGVSNNRGGDGKGNIIFAQSDRPVYRAGDVVYIRAILRRGQIGNYRIDHAPVTLDVMQGYPSHSVARRTLHPDEFGAIATSVQLPPDAALGEYEAKIDSDSVASFSVEAYKKPEYTIGITKPGAYTFAGDTATFTVHLAYLFGAAASNLKVHYSAQVNYRNYDWFGPYINRAERSDYDSAGGDIVTDDNGNAEVKIPTKRIGLDGTITLNADARDESGRTVSTEVEHSIRRATFHMLVEPLTWVGVVHSPNVVTVRTLNHDGTPHANQTVSASVVKWVWNGQRYDEHAVSTSIVHTDASGVGRFTYTANEPGDFRFDVSGRDERGDEIQTSASQWVFDPHSGWTPHIDQAQIVPFKTTFAPGEKLRATLVLTTPAREAIVAISSDHLVSHVVVPVNGLSATIVADAPRDAQHVRFDACIPSEQGVRCTNQTLAIDPPTKLNIVVKPDKREYKPGEVAKVRLHVTDRQGRAVRAQLSLGVVDEGIYAVLDNQQTDPNESFYQNVVYADGAASWYFPNAIPVEHSLKTIAKVTSRSAGNLVKAGVGSDVYNVNAAAANGMAELGGGGNLNSAYSAIANAPTRSHFADTAYWTSSAVTDANGDATVTFTWPDNLTTWRASALGVTVATQFGVQRANILVRKPLMARLEIPRFLRAGDIAQVTGIVHSDRVGSRSLLQFDPGVLGAKRAPVSLAIDQTKRASTTWELQDPGVGNARLALRAADEINSDGVELDLPLLGATPLGHDRSAGNLAESAQIPASLEAGELAGALHVSFAPSMLAQLAQTLRVFDVYPYYCTEQTSSNGLVAASMLLAGAKQSTLSLPSDPTRVIEKARARLAELRHTDGAWGWWPHDSTSIFMTAYALYAMDSMNRATGRKERDGVVDDTAMRLYNLLRDQQERASAEERALAWYALARTAPHLAQAFAVNPLLSGGTGDTLTTAYSGLAAVELGRNDLAERAAQRLLANATSNGGLMFWHEAQWSWRWWSDPIEETAVTGLLLHETHHEQQAQAALAFVRAQRTGDWWYTTMDTAMASMAIAQVEGPDAAGAPEETARVLVDGRVVATVHVHSLLPDASETHVVVPAEVMRHAHSVTLDRSGNGNLYWSSDFEKYTSASAALASSANDGVMAKLFAKPPSLKVSRVCSVPHPGAWHVGDQVSCDLWLTSRDGAEYVTLEDPYPAGTEYQPAQGEGATSWSGQQFLDDHAAFFFRALWPGETEHISYRLRATTPGTFAAPGPSAFASYGPPVAAVGAGERVTITP